MVEESNLEKINIFLTFQKISIYYWLYSFVNLPPILPPSPHFIITSVCMTDISDKKNEKQCKVAGSDFDKKEIKDSVGSIGCRNLEVAIK